MIFPRILQVKRKALVDKPRLYVNIPPAGFMTIENTDVPGNLLDYENTKAFTWAIQFSVPKFATTATIRNIISKQGSGFTIFYATAPNQLAFGYNHSTGSCYILLPTGAYAPINGKKYIYIVSSTGSGANTGLAHGLYDGDTGTLLSSSTTLGGTTAVASIKNTNQYKIGGTGDPLIINHFSAWNGVLTSPEKIDLVNRIIAKTVEGHSAYANCTNHYKRFTYNQGINEQDPLYNMTFSGF